MRSPNRKSDNNKEAKETNHDRLVEAVAYLRSKNYTIETIAQIIRCGKAHAHDLLKEAKARGLLLEFPPILTQKLWTDEFKKAACLLDYQEHLGEQLRKRSIDGKGRVHFQNLYVVGTGTFADGEKSMDYRIADFGRAAARVLYELITRSNGIGVAWGKTLAAGIRALRDVEGLPIQRNRHIDCVPTCGEPLGISARSDSASFLASELHDIINQDATPPASLTGVPAVIPNEFLASPLEFAAVQKFLQYAQGYRKVFGRNPAVAGDPKPLIDTIDTIFTSVGNIEKPWQMCGSELCEIGGIDPELFKKVVLGDIGGVLVPKKHLDPQHSVIFYNQICKLWQGIQLSHYQRVAIDASACFGDPYATPPGVVVLAIRSNKAEIIVRCVELGLINNLICDEELARALCINIGTPLPEEINFSKFKSMLDRAQKTDL